ncbi:MAG: hypothetical protein ACREMV_10385 [Gemmatimonadales bacterium]
MRRALLVPLVVAVAGIVQLVGHVPVTRWLAYVAVAGLVAVALLAPSLRRPTLAGIGVVLLLGSLRPAWGVVRKRDLRYGFSLTTVTQVFDPTAPERAPQTCSWITGSGPDALCAPDPLRRWRFLLLATGPAMIGIAIVLGAGATPPRHHPGLLQVLLMATGFATLGVLMVVANEGAGLATFRGATIRFTGMGSLHAVLGALALLAATVVMHRTTPRG